MCSFIKSGLLIFSMAIVPVGTLKAQPTLDWITVSNEVMTNWDVSQDPDDSGTAVYTSSWKRGNPDAFVGILALVPKKSSSYSLAFSSFLDTLYEYGIVASITLYNFDKDNERGLSMLRSLNTKSTSLIFSMGSESEEFLYTYYNGGAIPVVTAINKDPVLLGHVTDYTSGSGTNIAYTSLNVPIEIQIQYLNQLKPGLKNIGLMYNRNHKQVMATEVIPARELFKKYGIRVIDVAVNDRDTAVATLRERIPAALDDMRQNDPELERSVLWVTSSTAVFSNLNVVSSLSGNMPIISSVPNNVTGNDDSAVLAIGIDRRNNARLASVYAVNILRGTNQPGELPVGIVTPPDFAINFRIARRIGLKIPLSFVESATFIYGYDGELVRAFGQNLSP